MGVCFAIAAVVGVAIGLLLGMSASLDRGASPYLAALQSMPTGLWIPVAAIAIGTSIATLGAVVTIGAMPAVILGTRTAVKNIPPILLRAGHTFGESGLSMLRHVVLPAALPGILTGLELGWSIAFRCLVAGELFSGTLAGTGIGKVIGRSRESGNLTEMLATIVIILALSIAVDRLVFSRIQHRLRHTRGLVDSGLPH
jgi:NitT/TauT family transport system permease protein